MPLDLAAVTSVPLLVDRAYAIAEIAHAGQTRRDRKTPYITHIKRVMARLDRGPLREEVLAVAALHDVLEDSDLTVTDLRNAGIPEVVVAAVWVLTKMRDEDYDAYLSLVKANPLARAVKIADMLDNLSDSPTPAQIRKYAKGLLYLVDENTFG